MSWFTAETWKSKTFWGVFLLGIINALQQTGFDPSWLTFVETLLQPLTGMAAVDRSTKLIGAWKSK